MAELKQKKYLGQMLVEEGIITREQLEDALAAQRETGQRLGDILKKRKLVTDTQIMRVLEKQLGVPYIDLDRITISPEMASLLPVNIARRHKLVPVRNEGGRLQVAMEDPFSFLAIDDVRMVTHMEIQPLLAREDSILNAIEALYGNEYAEKAIEDFSRSQSLDEIAAEAAAVDIGNEVGSAPIVRLVNSLIEQAAREGASDIHVEPAESSVRVRFRVDGKLHTELTVPKEAQSALITRIKIMSDMNIAEKRVPQDGRYEVVIGDHNIDLRVSTLPGVYGEKVVMRLLDRTNFLRPKSELGFTQENLTKFDELLKNPNGIILVTGPTGSGKSTTLYTMLSELNSEADNIITIEDPVEYLIDGINQVQVNPKAGLTFATGLRSILRQDPDIIMIGEIRDQETVDIAVRAAITGHLVLSTIHTNDSASTISRLIDMGVESYMLSSALVGVISQRLVRRICPLCRQEYRPTANDLEFLGLPADSVETFYRGAGCGNCAETGYRGRIAVHEIMPITRPLRDMIHREAGVDEIRDYASLHGMSSLKAEAVKLLRAGVTTIDEVVKIAYTQEE
ncbi:MAG: Flp pilus assembly complex ATPase component TadA [Clostridiales bacterium]|nr:Flp pilus assembly complex ATPase component TadA [Clostridiales bacterium]